MMNELHLKMILAGIFSGAWPLFMNRSGLPGSMAAFVLVLVQLLIITPFLIRDIDLRIINYWAISAGICATIGLLIFTMGLDKIPKEQVSNFFVLMLVTQICVPAIYQIILTGVTPQRALGFAAAIIAAILLR